MAPAISKEKVSAIVVALFADNIQVQKKGEKKWCKKWLQQRHIYTHMNLLNELRVSEPIDFKNYLRMDDHSFRILLELLRPAITKQNTVMRDAISAEERLTLTLRYLATGNSFEDLKFSTAISPQSIGQIVPETCRAIYEALVKEGYLKVPSSEEAWEQIAIDFKKMWQFDNCLGAMDGKHILIKKPAKSGSFYYNYKGTYSVVLFAIVNANYEFLYVHTGTNGRVSDGGIWHQTGIYKGLKANKLNLPKERVLPNTNDLVPYVFLGDEAFPLMENLMKPYPQRGLTHHDRIFNYRLSRARRVVENVFGILASRFRVFLQPIATNVETIDAIVLACCALHNFLQRMSKKGYITEASIDREDINNGVIIPGEWRQIANLLSLERATGKNSSNTAKKVREAYKNYFNTVGKTTFQEKMIS